MTARLGRLKRHRLDPGQPGGRAGLGQPALVVAQPDAGRRARASDTLTTYTWVYTTVNGSPHVSRIYHYPSPVSGQQFEDAVFTYLHDAYIVSLFTCVPPYTPSQCQLAGQPLTRASGCAWCKRPGRKTTRWIRIPA